MEWSVICVFLCLLGYIEGGALKCVPGSQNGACSTDSTNEVEKKNSPSPAQCLRGSEWQSNCHDCKCSDTGVAICTKQQTCSEPFAEPIKCRPNTTFVNECNVCVCLDNGNLLCTIKSCGPVDDFNPDMRCAPNTMWKNDCNSCWCTSTGLPICTKKKCVEVIDFHDYIPMPQKYIECAIGTTWKSRCNECRCTDEGTVSCTEKACSSEVTEPERVCAPRSQWDDGCNACTCSPTGEAAACTAMLCLMPKVPPTTERPMGDRCAVGSRWQSRCNECRCTDAGLPECTDMDCSPDETEPELSCAPNTKWQYGCNVCTCSSSGSIECTNMDCQFKLEPIVLEALKTANKSPLNEAKHDVVKHKNIDSKNLKIEHIESTMDEYFEKENPYYVNIDQMANELSSYESYVPENTETEHAIYMDNQIDTEDYDVNFRQKNNKEYNSKYNLDNDDHFENNNSNNLKSDENIQHKTNLSRIKKETKQNGDFNLHKILKRSVCKPNQVFQSECNPCKCAPDGNSYTCTHNECMEGDTNKEVEVFMETEGVDHIERHSVCKPRGTFYIGCNTCHCNPYGTDYSCTNKPCPLPEDVELFHELKEMKPIVPYVSKETIPNQNSTHIAEKSTKNFKNNEKTTIK